MVIGVAARGKVWAHEVCEHPRFELATLADLDPQAMIQCADELELGDVAHCTDFRQPLVTGEIDVVINAAATTAHYPITRDVLEAGAHCLVEKPFTLDVGEAKQLVALAAERKLTLAVGQNYRFNAMCRFVQQAIAERTYGDLIEVVGRFHRMRPPRPTDANIAFPMLFIQGVHHLDWLAAIVPGPLELRHAAHHLPPDSKWTSPTICHVQMTGAGGVPVTYHGSYDARGANTGYAGLWRFAFTGGDLLVDNDGHTWLERDTPDGPAREQVFDVKAAAPTGERRLLDTVHAGIAEGVEPPTSGRANIAVLQLLFDICAQHAPAN
jgi:predicted dehydrogenase